MLKLTRNVGESVMISEGATLTILEIKDNRIRFGIKAPDDVAIQIYNRIRAGIMSAGELAERAKRLST